LPTLNQTFAAMADEAGGPGVPISERRSLLRAVGLLPLQEILFGRNIGDTKNQNGRSNMQSKVQIRALPQLHWPHLSRPRQQ